MNYFHLYTMYSVRRNGEIFEIMAPRGMGVVDCGTMEEMNNKCILLNDSIIEDFDCLDDDA